MFVATGLLGTPSLLQSSSSKDLPESTTFVATSLLGEPHREKKQDERNSFVSSSREALPPYHEAELAAFISTGLLGAPAGSGEIETRPAAGPSSPSNRIQERDAFSFVSNGLFNPIPPEVDTEDDDIPSVCEAFGIRSRLPQAPSSIQIPRSTLRATTFDGKTVYLRRKPKVFSTTTQTSNASSSRMRNLLEVPIHRLMDQLSASTAADLQRNEGAPQNQAADVRGTSIEDQLWVDRYRPSKYTDLLGNERVARDAMTWIKQWDWCVFGKSRGKKRSRDGDENLELDEFHRPKEKILLLSGPPGFGKTTLAHVLARQAGYEVMEINASDARSGAVVEDRIRPTLEAGSKVGSSKPVLLVIDEIDGATGAGDSSSTFIHKLVQLINAKPRKKKRSGQNKDYNRGDRPILRPIICICNEHNASSLTKLRPHAYQIRFARPADIHIVKRLKEVCRTEGMKADSRALSTLVSVAKGDLRGCLNTLQFIKTRNEDVTEPIIRKATSGMKEADTNYISVLNNLFTPLSKKRVKELALTDEDEARFVSRLSGEVEASGRESNIASGCFGHYVTLRRHDANLSRHEQATEWLTTFDNFSSTMYSEGDFSLNPYLPYTLVPFYPLFQERGGEKVERNQADWEHFQLMRSNEEVLKSLSRCLRTATVRHGGDFRHLLSHPVLQTEFVPYINRIISPPLRPVNSQVIRPLEKALMSRLVDIMATLELRFVQERADDGQLSYRLDPPIDVFVTYDGKRAADITVSRYAVRHLVSAEIDAKLISRDTEFVEKGKRRKHDFFGQTRSNVGDDVDDADAPANKRHKKDTRDIADKPPTDFFGRLITVSSGSTSRIGIHKAIEKQYRVSYRFLEGNSAAVRKPVKVNTFL
ncbi:unnamed protein product [Cyclocybe aegerita]|uniref:AAA+ ATPase domain-containing protein n=1 Tax=Cyclocybe aegerita TaxID=1973307 RepID=A0A8S0W5N1_CYCAE|nr:unnamed protein product [Cyclocybe aegerita]